MNRVVIGGLVGGLVVFVWSVVAHTALPLGRVGIDSLPEEATVVAAMRDTIREPGLYLFPGMDMDREPSAEEMQALKESYREGPIGLLVYHPTGREPMTLMQFVRQLLTDLAAGLIAAIVLGMIAAPGFGVRVLVVGLLGLFSWLSISVPHWNWSGFPADFTAAGAVEQVVGWLLAGAAMAAIIKPRA